MYPVLPAISASVASKGVDVASNGTGVASDEAGVASYGAGVASNGFSVAGNEAGVSVNEAGTASNGVGASSSGGRIPLVEDRSPVCQVVGTIRGERRRFAVGWIDYVPAGVVGIVVAVGGYCSSKCSGYCCRDSAMLQEIA